MPFGDDLTGAFLDRGRQSVGLVVFTIRRNLCGVFLQAIVIQDVAVTGRVVITAHPKADEIAASRKSIAQAGYGLRALACDELYYNLEQRRWK